MIKSLEMMAKLGEMIKYYNRKATNVYGTTRFLHEIKFELDKSIYEYNDQLFIEDTDICIEGMHSEVVPMDNLLIIFLPFNDYQYDLIVIKNQLLDKSEKVLNLLNDLQQVVSDSVDRYWNRPIGDVIIWDSNCIFHNYKDGIEDVDNGIKFGVRWSSVYNIGNGIYIQLNDYSGNNSQIQVVIYTNLVVLGEI